MQCQVDLQLQVDLETLLMTQMIRILEHTTLFMDNLIIRLMGLIQLGRMDYGLTTILELVQIVVTVKQVTQAPIGVIILEAQLQVMDRLQPGEVQSDVDQLLDMMEIQNQFVNNSILLIDLL